MEEYGPTILHHLGKNVFADTFSRLLHHIELPILVGENAPVVLFDFTSKGLDISNNPVLLECFLNLPLLNIAENNPVDLGWIHEQQNIGNELATKTIKHPDHNFDKTLDGHVILCFASPNEGRDTQWKIAITKEMVVPLIKLFHTLLAHPGRKCSRMTLQSHYNHPDMRQQVDEFHFDYCQYVKIPCKGMGLLPECDLTNTLWYKVAIDLIRPWFAKTEKLVVNSMP